LNARRISLFAKLLAAQIDSQEKALHHGLPESFAKVLSGKRIWVREQLLRKYQYDTDVWVDSSSLQF